MDQTEPAEGLHVLVVDDEQVIRSFLLDVLSTKGYRVAAAASGEEALTMLDAQSFDILITDLYMPGISGLQLIQSTNEQYPDLPKIIITGAGTTEDAIQAVKVGAYDFIQKPLDMEELIVVLDRAVDHRRLVTANLEYQRQLEESNQRLEQRVKERTEKLKASEEKFRGLFETAIDAIFIVDRQGRYRNGNRSGLTMLACSEEEMKQLSLAETLADFDDVWPDIESRLGEGEPISGLESRILRRGGDSVNVEISASPEVDRAGRIRGYQLIMRDITARKKAEAEIQRQNVELERMNRLKDEFLAQLSHELLTPLAPLKGYLSIIRQNPADLSAVVSITEEAQQEAARLQQILESLIDLAHMVSGMGKIPLMPLDVNPSIQAAVDQIREAAAKKNIRLRIRLDERLPCVLADTTKIQQLLFNLLSNAVKFTEAGGDVSAESEAEPGWVSIRIRDSGIGIAEEDMPHIFDPFHRIDGSTRRKRGGIGIGLSLVKKLVELHGGTISVESRSGAGSIFTVKLPACG